MQSILQYFILPSNLIVVSLLLGVGALAARRTRRTGRGLLVVAGLLYGVFGSGPVAFALLGHLEYQFRPWAEDLEADSTHVVVVLAGFGELAEGVPLSSSVNDATAFRLIEALRAYHRLQDVTIIVTGDNQVCRIMADLLVSMGVVPDDILVRGGAASTYGSAEDVNALVGEAPFLLVTSAGHMPRAMLMFQSLGLHPVPAPTDFQTRPNPFATRYLPSPRHLAISDRAIMEYVGIWWFLLSVGQP
ncbi:MAG: YdcF family protein [Pseudomonadota bacterium]